MSFKTPDGAILHPQFSDRALVNVTPTTFVRKLLQENPDIPCRLLTSNNVMCVFKGMLAARPLKESKFPDIRAQYLHMLDRWESSADWNFVCQMLDGNPPLKQGYLPYGQRSEGPCAFAYHGRNFSLPPATEYLFPTRDGLDIQKFIEELVSCNRAQAELLSPRAVLAAAAAFAEQRFPRAVPGLKEQCLDQLERPRGIQALREHEMWLLSRPPKTIAKDSYRPTGGKDRDYPRQMLEEDRESSYKNGSGKDSYRPTMVMEENRVSSRKQGIGTDFYRPKNAGVVKNPNSGALSMAHHQPRADIPKPLLEGISPPQGRLLQVQYLSENHRARLISSGKAILVSLPSLTGLAASTTRTHIHLLREGSGARGPEKTQVEIIPEYDPSLVMAFKDLTFAEKALSWLANCKFSLSGNEPIHLTVEKLTDNRRSSKTIYSLASGPVDIQSPYAIHLALMQFFVNKSYVPSADIISETVAGVQKSKVRASYRDSPNWLQKLAVIRGGHQETFVPAEQAETCSICRLSQYPHGLQASTNVLVGVTSPPKNLANGVKCEQAEVAVGEKSPKKDAVIGMNSPRGGFFVGLQSPQNEVKQTDNRADSAKSGPEKDSLELPIGAGSPHDTDEDAPWKIPAALCPLLGRLTISHFISAFVKLNGNEIFAKASAQQLIGAFNHFVDINYPDSTYEAKLAVLHRIDHSLPLGAFQPLSQELVEFKHLLAKGTNPAQPENEGDDALDSCVSGGKGPKRKVCIEHEVEESCHLSKKKMKMDDEEGSVPKDGGAEADDFLLSLEKELGQCPIDM